MIELSSQQDLIFKDRKRFFDCCNFIFGSSEVYFFKNGVLGINRKNKFNTLKGSLPDKTYRVEKIFSLNVRVAA
jgi:hypothetical protein